MAIARLIRTLAGIVAAVIVLGIILRVLGANPHNGIVSAVHDAGLWLVGPFKNVFSVRDVKLNMALNWGLAALVYVLIGSLIAWILASGSLAARSRRAHPVA